jgi:transcriptional regulator with XRE-family HTH domain
MTGLREILAHNLRKKRRNHGISQAKLAEMVNVSTHHIATIETARNYPTLDLVERLANALDIEIYELFIDPISLSPPPPPKKWSDSIRRSRKILKKQ